MRRSYLNDTLAVKMDYLAGWGLLTALIYLALIGVTVSANEQLRNRL